MAVTPVVTTILTVIAGLLVICRCVVRFLMVRNAGRDDALILLALPANIAVAVILVISQNLVNQTLAGNDMTEQFFLMEWAFMIPYILGLMFVKLAILFQCLRFFVDLRLRRIAWFLIVFVTLQSLASVLAHSFSCTPVQKYWSPNVADIVYCFNISALLYAIAALEIITDIAVSILPVVVLSDLQGFGKQKILLLVVFIMGGFGCIASIVRIPFIVPTVADDFDLERFLIMNIWGGIELSIGTICASLPTLKPLIDKVFPSLLSESRDSSNENYLSTCLPGLPLDHHPTSITESSDDRDSRPRDLEAQEVEAFSNIEEKSKSQTTGN